MGESKIQGVPNESTIIIWLYFDENSIFWGMFCLLCSTASEVTVYKEKSSTNVSFTFYLYDSKRTFCDGFDDNFCPLQSHCVYI
jgi:hypothetical protein